MNTSKSLDDAFKDFLEDYPQFSYEVGQMKGAIVEAVEGLLPDKISIEFSKYHHQTQVDGWNDYRAAVLQAIKEWQ